MRVAAFDMADPTKDGQSKGCWEPGIGDEESHVVAGIADKFFFQLAVGGGESAWGNSPTCHGAPEVTGIGNEKAGQT